VIQRGRHIRKVRHRLEKWPAWEALPGKAGAYCFIIGFS